MLARNFIIILILPCVTKAGCADKLVCFVLFSLSVFVGFFLVVVVCLFWFLFFVCLFFVVVLFLFVLFCFVFCFKMSTHRQERLTKRRKGDTHISKQIKSFCDCGCDFIGGIVSDTHTHTRARARAHTH